MAVIPFPHSTAPIGPVGHFIRLGESGYQKLASLHAAGRLPATRVVADASKIRHQKELLEAFRAAGTEIVLDTKVAELGSQEKFAGYAHGAPWASLVEGQPLGPDVFAANAAEEEARAGAARVPVGLQRPVRRKQRHRRHSRGRRRYGVAGLG